MEAVRIAVVPGSFDPVTLGHLDVIGRAAKLFDRVFVVVTHNPGKSALLGVDERVRLLQESLADAGIVGVQVDSWSEGLLVDYCRRVGAEAIVKGLRSATDAAYETPMALVNRDLAGVETLFLVARPPRATSPARWCGRSPRSAATSRRTCRARSSPRCSRRDPSVAEVARGLHRPPAAARPRHRRHRDRQAPGRASRSASASSACTATSRPTGSGTAARTRRSTPTRRRTPTGSRATSTARSRPGCSARTSARAAST